MKFYITFFRVWPLEITLAETPRALVERYVEFAETLVRDELGVGKEQMIIEKWG